MKKRERGNQIPPISVSNLLLEILLEFEKEVRVFRGFGRERGLDGGENGEITAQKRAHPTRDQA